MKIAIIGHEPNCLLYTNYFVNLGARVDLWSSKNPVNLYNELESPGFDLKELAGKMGHSSEQVKFIKKSYLKVNEKLEKRSRFVDDFSIVYEKDELDFYENYDFIIDFEAEDMKRNNRHSSLPILNIHRIEKFIKKDLKNVNANKVLFLCSDENELGEIAKSMDFQKVYFSFLDKKIIESSSFKKFETQLESDWDVQVENFENNKKSGNRTIEPEKKFHFFKSLTLKSFNYFEDNESIFATFEEFPWEGEKALTFPIDDVFFLGKFKEKKISKGVFLNDDEIGYYNINKGINREMHQLNIENIWHEMSQYFKRGHE